MKTRAGTSYFPSMSAAIDYFQIYEPYEGRGTVAKHVEAKLAEGEIHIGKPELKPGQSLYLDKTENRYFIYED